MFCVAPMHGTEDGEEFDYTPRFEGVFRGRFEHSVDEDESRFQVRNARVSVFGDVAPIISYKIQVDLCDRGKFSPLDAWAGIDVMPELNFRIGQFRQPFGTDCFRGPANYYFSNRSFMARTVANVRGVGFQGSYSLRAVPVTLAASVFNPTGIADHNKWVKKYACATKLSYSPSFGDPSHRNSYGKGSSAVRLALGFMSLRPAETRMNLIGASAGWSDEHWLVEGEFMREHYTNSSFRACNAFNIFVNWGKAVSLGDFNRWSVQGRFDSMSRHSNGVPDESGHLFANQNSRSRVTVGTTLGYSYRKVRADIRLDYEQYFYGHGGRGDEEGSRIVAELVVSF